MVDSIDRGDGHAGILPLPDAAGVVIGFATSMKPLRQGSGFT